MATGPLLALLFAAVPQAWAGLTGFLEGNEGVAAVVPVLDAAEPPARVPAARPGKPTRHRGDAAVTVGRAREGGAVRTHALPAVVIVDEPLRAPLEIARPRPAVWRSPAPPQGPPA